MHSGNWGAVRECSFFQTLRYAQKIIIEISTICLQQFFEQALILKKNRYSRTAAYEGNNLHISCRIFIRLQVGQKCKQDA